jgi:subtilisin family serine protease
MNYIVQADSLATAATAVEQAGGTITHELGIINGVAARLDTAAVEQLQTNPQISLHANMRVRSADDDDGDDDDDDGDDDDGDDDRETYTAGFDLYPSVAVNVSSLHEQTVSTPEMECKKNRIKFKNQWNEEPLTGVGVTVAVVDTGFLPMVSSSDWEHYDNRTNTLVAENSGRCIIYRDFVESSDPDNSSDGYGHGTHIATTIADNREAVMAAGANAMPVGVAPQVNLVLARALDEYGSGSYADVIAAIDWVVANKDAYSIRVLNLSLYSPVGGFYWEDPLNQAVMRAWQEGIVVVTVAGNDGPEAGTIMAPGNVPYVLTVGALTNGRYTSSGLDELADYSARGPTESAFVKPDVIVPATRTIAPMHMQSNLAEELGYKRVASFQQMDMKIGNPHWLHAYYELSGTSMAAAEVSGIVALMLQANPELTPDQVKYRLLATARPAVDAETAEPLYTIWEQGAGLVDAEQAVLTTTLRAANVGMDIALDLDPDSTEHYWGYTTWDEASGEFWLLDPESGEELVAWGGGRRSSAGSTWLWSAGRRSSAGSSEIWSAGRRSSAGSLSWAGSDMPWMQPGTQSDSLSTRLVVEEDIPVHTDDSSAETTQRVWLPVVRHSGN